MSVATQRVHARSLGQRNAARRFHISSRGQQFKRFSTWKTHGSRQNVSRRQPAPYRNGEEMAVEPGLPLGLLAEATYAETRYRLAPEDKLTFVSDGVIEATNPQGELYGFVRTQAISNQPANAIAEAATQFGQEDDITVLSVTRTVDLNPLMA